MAKSSINIQISSIFAFFHAAREAIVTYLIDNPSRNVVDRDGDKSYEYYLALFTEAITNYMQRTGQKIQTDKKKYIWEAVVNLTKEHTLKDLKLLADVLEKLYGWQVIQLSIHLDEGHIDIETGEKIYNIHGHMVFFMLNKQGIYCFKKRDFGIKIMEELQTLTARVLKMERGISKKKTKRERLNPKQYRYVAQLIEKITNEFNLIIEEDELCMLGQKKEIWKLMDLSDHHIFEIAKLEDWRENVLKDIFDAKKDGFLTAESSLDKYIPSYPPEAGIKGQSIKIISSEDMIDNKSFDHDGSTNNIKI